MINSPFYLLLRLSVLISTMLSGQFTLFLEKIDDCIAKYDIRFRYLYKCAVCYFVLSSVCSFASSFRVFVPNYEHTSYTFHRPLCYVFRLSVRVPTLPTYISVSTWCSSVSSSPQIVKTDSFI